MSTFFETANANTTAATSTKKATVWINIGVVGKDGTFISLPYNLALDTMPEMKVSGSPEFQKLANAKNKLLHKLLDKAATLQAGEVANITLTCQLQKVKDSINNTDDTYGIDDLTF